MSAIENCCYSVQESILFALQKGKEHPERKNKERLFKIHDRYADTTPIIDTERGRLFTESMMRTEGQHLSLRWAKALMHIAQNITIYIDDDQLLAGRCGTNEARYGILFPELDGDFIGDTLENMAERSTMQMKISPEGLDVVKNIIVPYWKGKTLHEEMVKSLPPEAKRLTYNDDDGFYTRYITPETTSFRTCITWSLDYDKIVNKGFKWVKEQAQNRLEQLDPESPVDMAEKIPFCQSVMLMCDAIVVWSQRHAGLAYAMAESESNPQRKEELLLMAKNCERVPEYPATTFHEALQAHWLAQMFSRFEARTGGVISNGRMDQLLYPFYKKDKEAGILDDKKATELLDCMWVAMSQFIDLCVTPSQTAMQAGHASWEAVTVGGLDAQGEDATNELTYLFLKSRQGSPLHHPDLAVRVHSRTPDRLYWEIAETIKHGQGYPKLINDDCVVPLYLAKGAPLEHAYDYAFSGCTEVRMANYDTYSSCSSQVNLAAVLELTLYNGRMLKHGDELLTLETGEIYTFKSWEGFYAAFEKQLSYVLANIFRNQYIIDQVRSRHFATPLASGLHDICLAECRDMNYHSYFGGLRQGYYDIFGFATAIDSLAAMKHYIYDTKELSFERLMPALKTNFENDPSLRAMLANGPSYGNNNALADSIGRNVDRLTLEFNRKHAKALGARLDQRMVPVTGNIIHGKEVSALPNGRRAWTALSDGSSASHGADVNGPIAILQSNANTMNKDLSERGARLLNVKLTPQCIKGDDGTAKLVSLLQAFCSLGLWHIQFNVINQQTLIEAQKYPEKYKSLIVRIAGYSAYFGELSKEMQDDLIGRTMHEAL